MPDTINTNDLRRGTVIELPDGLFQVMEYAHHKPGKGPAMVRTKLRNLRSGSVVDRTFGSDAKVPVASLDRRDMQYLYPEGDTHHFMDNESYEQVALGADDLGDNTRFLVEGISVQVAFYEGRALSVDLPTTVDVRVSHSDPGVRGDRSNAGTKPAQIETGATIQVPLFVDTGDKIRVDTRTGEYVTRVQES